MKFKVSYYDFDTDKYVTKDCDQMGFVNDMTIVDDEKDIPWPDPLDYSKIKNSKEKLDQNFKDGIRYIQG